MLSDPTKRKAYDASDLDKVAPHEVDGVDVSTLGGLGRVFGAVISRFGVPVSTQINADLVEEAQAIAK